MSLFQKSVLNKYLSAQDQQLIQSQYQLYKSYFLNSTIQKNILASKEEEFQEGFLRELFVKILGYTINPEPDYNLKTELKNQKDSKKADGAIVNGDKVLAVIELKSTTTTDLNKIEIQAFNYKNNQNDCRYIITSNFQKIRFYIDNAIEYLEWDLFRLDHDEFKLLYLCLSKQNIFLNLPATIKSESITEEENVTKKLYKEYSSFRKELFNNIAENNSQFDKLQLFKKTQKLLDRFLFLFFAEDRNLVPPNSVRSILEQWVELKEKFDEYQPLYDRFRKYFGYLNNGFTGKQHEIFAYNGGLFASDEILDSIKIGDEILYQATLSLSRYDYNSDVDVNILGHIFEHSLTEIEELESSIISGDEAPSKTSKRKKDGVFYTPKYITKYIVENTVGALCNQKKEELQLQEEDYHSLSKKERKNLNDTLQKYKDWLLGITIVDPACGSGAFLNQALEFLIAEHNWIAELEAKIFNSPLVLSDVETSILENNLFGVDINEESVEIAKLSLWLRTARRGRKLNSLNNNIKCGNSLIDDPAIAGDKAFNWQQQFPHIFAKGGFDVVIGNPPYGAELNSFEKKFVDTHYKTTQYNYDSYIYFFEKSLEIIKESSLVGLITPNTYLVVENGDKLRSLLFSSNQLIQLFEVLEVFPDAVVEPIVTILKKQKPTPNHSFIVRYLPRKSSKINFDRNIIENRFNQDDLVEDKLLLFNYKSTMEKKNLIKKIYENSYSLNDLAQVTTGIKPYQVGKGKPAQTKEIVDEKPFTKIELVENLGAEWRKLIRGTQVNRYRLDWEGEYIKYGSWLAEPREPEIFNSPKLFIRRTDDRLLTVYDDSGIVGLNSVHTIRCKKQGISNLSLMALLNSKLMNFVFRYQNFHMVGKPLAEVKVVYVERLPIKIPNTNIEELAIRQLELVNKFNFIEKRFLNLLLSKYALANAKGLRLWHQLTFYEFIKELNKQKIKLSLQEEAEWLSFFENEKKQISSLRSEISNNDNKIDQIIYQLYELNEQEISIVSFEI